MAAAERRGWPGAARDRDLALRRIAARLKAVVRAPGDAQAAHGQLLQNDIARFLARPYPQTKPGVPPTVPPGAPIGAAWGSVDEEWCSMRAAGEEPFFAPLIRRGAQ